MLNPGEYADILRAIGWTLDQRLDGQTTARVEIVIRGSGIVVGWTSNEGSPERQRYAPTDLEMLRERARTLRAGAAEHASGDQAESLRTIGQYLDEHRIQLERLVQLPEGHRITGVYQWYSLGQWYEPTLVREMSAERRRLRNIGSTMGMDRSGTASPGDARS